MLGDPLLTPVLDTNEVGLGEINGHTGRLSVDIGEIAAQERFRDCGLGDLAQTGASAVELSRVRDFISGWAMRRPAAPATMRACLPSPRTGSGMLSSWTWLPPEDS
jgi:hypothetical protein